MTETLKVRAASLRLTPEIAENIRNLSFEGLKALPRKGAEIGGLITASGASPALGDDLILVTCEHLFGPSFHLSGNDLPLLRQAAERCRRDRRVAAAFFRSCTGSHDVIDANDQHAILEACPEVPFVVLARPSPDGRASIGIYRRGVDLRWTLTDEFPVSPPGGNSVPLHGGHIQPREPLRARESTALSAPESAGEAPLDQKEAALDEIPDGTATNEALWVARSWWLLLPVTALLGAFLFFVMRTKPQQPLESRVATPAPGGASARNDVGDRAAGLAVRPEGGQLHLTWNRNADAVKSANSGVLFIEDGQSPVVLVLGPRDLTEGSLVYTPHSSDVNFRLRLLSSPDSTPGPETEEVIRVVGAAVAPLSVTAGKAEKTPPAAPKGVLTAEPVSRKAVTPVAVAPAAITPATVASAAVTPAAVASAAATPAAVAPAAVATPEAVRVVGTASESALPPPVIAEQQARPAASQANAIPVANPNPSNRPPNNQQAIASDSDRANTPPVPREAAVTRQSQPEAPVPTPTPVPTAAPVPTASAPAVAAPSAPSTAALIPPVPSRQVVPRITVADLRVLVTTKIVILVSVDARGNVTEAKSETDYKGNPYLQVVAVDAARQWKFKPATLRGQPVASETRLTFVFPPR